MENDSSDDNRQHIWSVRCSISTPFAAVSGIGVSLHEMIYYRQNIKRSEMNYFGLVFAMVACIAMSAISAPQKRHSRL